MYTGSCFSDWIFINCMRINEYQTERALLSFRYNFKYILNPGNLPTFSDKWSSSCFN